MQQLSAVEHQEEMPLSKAAKEQDAIPDSIVFIQPSFKSVLNLAVTTAALEDQDVYKPLGIDKAQWSRIKSGQANFPNDRIGRFHDLVQNDIVIRWLAFQTKRTVKPLLTTLEEQLEILTAEKNQLAHDNKLMRELLSK